MKIYFCAGVRAGRQDQQLYQSIIRLLHRHGAVMTEHLGEVRLTAAGEMALEDTAIFQRDKSWLREADAVVAEVSVPSTGVGMELGYADEWGKPTLCLHGNHAGRMLSAMVAGCPRFVVARYEGIEHVASIIERFFIGRS